jgi:glycosyltransferase involved in cell wall biosynthesis
MLFLGFAAQAAPEISVIIPVYNTEKFLPGCLESIINQDFKDIEIICINDGSSDNSLSVLQKYAKNDKRIKVFSQKNRGVSAARNVGLEKATGKYIAFIDSDDSANPTMLRKLHEIAIGYGCDIAMCDVEVENITKDAVRRNKDISNGKPVLVMEKYPHNPARNMLIIACWNKLYKKSIIGDLRFNEQINAFEDLHFNFLVFFKSRRHVFLAEKLYVCCRGNQNSITRSGSYQKKIIKFLSIVIKDLYQRVGTTLEEKDQLKKNTLNDLAVGIFSLGCEDFSDMLISAQKVNELYCDRIIDLNMECEFKIFAVAVIMLGKAVNFVKGLTDAF